MRSQLLSSSEPQAPAYPLSAPPQTSHVSKEPRFLLKPEEMVFRNQGLDGRVSCSLRCLRPPRASSQVPRSPAMPPACPSTLAPWWQLLHWGWGGVGAWCESIRAFGCKLCAILSCLITFPRVAIMSYTDGAAQSRRNAFAHSLEAARPLGLRGRGLRPRRLLGAVAAAHRPHLRLHPPVFSVSLCLNFPLLTRATRASMTHLDRTCKDSASKRGQVLRFWDEGGAASSGDTVQTSTPAVGSPLLV